MATQGKELIPEDIPIVCEFKDIFPEKLLGLPPQREINFEIELTPGSQTISNAPYHMAPTKLKESKIQLEELLKKRHIKPSVSSWGAPVLFIK